MARLKKSHPFSLREDPVGRVSSSSPDSSGGDGGPQLDERDQRLKQVWGGPQEEALERN